MSTRTIEIVSGLSAPGSVTLTSETHVAHARWSGGVLTCDVRARSAAEMSVVGGPWWLPKTLQMIVAITTQMPWPVVAAVAAVNALPRLSTHGSNVAVADGVVRLAFEYLTLVAATWLVTRTRPWHAAEHQAVAAYAQAGDDVTCADIGRAGRIDPMCGGRLALPLVLAAVLNSALHGSGWHMLAMVELILWIDSGWGWSKIPVFAQASTLLQRYITTSPSHEAAIATAGAALRGLIDAAPARDDTLVQVQSS